jgi:hypothetical protein
MKNRIFALLATLSLAGCAHGQLIVTPPLAPTCPPPGSSTYTPLNASGTTNLSYTATGVTTQTCFIVQGTLGSQTSSWSNVVGPAVGGATNSVTLTVTCSVPSPNPNNETCTGDKWVFSSAPAIVPLAPAVPSIGSPASAELEKRQGPAITLAAVGR